MYNFKINNQSKELELVKEMMNCHPSVIDKKGFDEVFTREYARFEYFALLAKIMNGTSKADDEVKCDLLREQFNFLDSENIMDISDVPDALKALMILTLFAHGKLLKKFGKDENDNYRITSEFLTLGMSDFYKACRNAVLNVENGCLTLEDAVKIIKPLYNDATLIINHEAVEGICKKWTESTKEKVSRSFVTGLLARYKITRSNRIKAESPLKSEEAFERYFAMWLVTNGEMVSKVGQNKKSAETLESICNRK